MKKDEEVLYSEVSLQLKKILASEVFRKSKLLSSFLTFIVQARQNKQEHQIKEYTIGLSVFNKKPDYNTQDDPTVRIHAVRLRKALASYYAIHGKSDRIRITIPKGTYIPAFERSDLSRQVVATEIIKPVLAILPFTFHDNKLAALADGLCDQISTEFSIYNEIAVVAYYSSKAISAVVSGIEEIGRSLNADYLLTGNIQCTSSQFRIRVQLIQNEGQFQIWGHTYEGKLESLNTFSIQDDIVNHVVNQIAGTHGILNRQSVKTKQARQPLDIKVYDAVYWYYYLTGELTQEIYDRACQAMNQAVNANPHYSLGWAILGEIYVAGYFYGFTSKISDPLDKALKCGEEALKHDINCQNAYQTLGLANLFLKRRADCIRIADQWTKLNRNMAGVAGGLGFCLICCGEFDRGYQMLSESIKLNPYYPWWFNAGLSIYAFYNHRFEDCILWADKLKGMSPEWENILKAAAYANIGNEKEAIICLGNIPQITDASLQELSQYLGSFLLYDPIKSELLTAIKSLQNSRIA